MWGLFNNRIRILQETVHIQEKTIYSLQREIDSLRNDRDAFKEMHNETAIKYFTLLGESIDD